jgi:rare lipoprotein A
MTIHPAEEAGRRSASSFRNSLGRQLDGMVALAATVAEDWGYDGLDPGSIALGMGYAPGFSPAFRRSGNPALQGHVPRSLGGGEVGKVEGVPSGVGGYNFMGSEAAKAMGMGDVTPAGPLAHLTFPTGIPEGEGPTSIQANKYAGTDMAGFLKDLHEAGAPLKNFSGVYSPRQKRNGGGWSQHAYGNAMDIETGFGSGPDNSPYLYKWSQEHPKEFAEIQAKHHMRNLYSSEPGKTKDWGHFEWTPTAYAKNNQTPAGETAGAGGAGKPPVLATVAPGFAPAPAGTPITGEASTYNPFKSGWRGGGGTTASGEPYDPQAWTAAIQTGQRGKFGGVGYGKDYQPSYAMVEHEGKQAIVRINDVGPLTRGRIIDLNERSMRYFDPTAQKGVLPGVKVTPLAGANWTPGPVTPREATMPPIPEPAKPNFSDVQVADKP